MFAPVQDAAAVEQNFLTGKLIAPVTRAPHAPFHGIVVEMLVHPGQHVAQGDLLFKYSLQDEQRRNLQREVDQGAGTATIEGQNIDLQRELVRTEAQRNKARSLASSGLGSNQALSRMEQEVSSLNKRISLNRQSIARAEHNFDVRLKELSDYFNEPIHEGQTLPTYLYIKSPIDGYVVNIDANLAPGVTFAAGHAPVTLAQLDPMRIQVPVYEADVANIKVGDHATVQIPSLQNKKFQAEVSDISWVANDMNVSVASYYNVQFSIKNPNLELKPGFKAIVQFSK